MSKPPSPGPTEPERAPRVSIFVPAYNEAANRDQKLRISTPSSRIAAYVIKTDENLMIARHARALVGN